MVVYNHQHSASYLMNLVRENRKGEMKTLLDQGADVNGTQYSWTFLHQVAYCGHLNMAKLLFRHGIVLDTTDYKRRTAKDVAIRYGNTHIADAIDTEMAHRLMNERVTTPQATSGSTSKKAGGACAQGRRNLHASSCRPVE